MSTSNRVVNRLLAALLALVLFLAALLGFAEILTALFGGGRLIIPRDEWLADLRALTWDAGSVRVFATALVVVGLLLLIAGISARSRILPMRPPNPSVVVTASARGLAQILRRQAESVPGVAEASAEVSAKAARVVVSVPLADPARVERELGTVLATSLRQMPWAQPPELTIELNSPRESPPPPARDRVSQ